MVTVVPAAGISLFFIFIVGAYFTEVLLNQLSKDIKKNPHFYGDTLSKIASQLTEGVKEKISYIGGGIAIGLLVLLIFNTPIEWRSIIWYGLTAIGIVLGIFTFFIK